MDRQRGGNQRSLERAVCVRVGRRGSPLTLTPWVSLVTSEPQAVTVISTTEPSTVAASRFLVLEPKGSKGVSMDSINGILPVSSGDPCHGARAGTTRRG